MRMKKNTTVKLQQAILTIPTKLLRLYRTKPFSLHNVFQTKVSKTY